ncbi:MAG: glycosyltransferase family 39 protein [Clostridiales bacterium]|nr:glycosyltransferase family 39 protein [Clostridiales bacterium]
MKLKKESVEEIYKNLILVLVIFLLFIISYNTGSLNDVKAIQKYMKLMILSTLCIFAMLWFFRKEKKPDLLPILILIGFVMRIGYMLYTDSGVRGHDAGIISLDGYGHRSYIYRIYEYLKLPDINKGQMYHPPLYHFLSAIAMYLVRPFTSKNDAVHLIEAAKIVSCFASCATLRVGLRICKELQLSHRVQLVTIGFLAFLPNMYLLAGRVNNDALAYYFMFMIVLYTIRWYKEKSYKNTIILALLFGMGMSTKISCGVLALITGILMIISFIQAIKNGSAVQIVKRLLCFGLICFPLGLWYPIRNYLLFHQPFNYVLEISKTHDLYCGDWSFFKRFISVPLKNLFQQTYNLPYEDYNTTTYLIRGALFGEFTFDINEIIPKFLIFVYLILLVISLISMVRRFMEGVKCAANRTISDKAWNEKFVLFGFPILWLVTMGSYFTFNIKYPFGCTMDYRYVVMVAFVNAVMLGISYDHAAGNVKADRIIDGKKWRIFLNKTIEILMLLFIAVSIIMYCNIN